jgi:hypothetical protein
MSLDIMNCKKVFYLRGFMSRMLIPTQQKISSNALSDLKT